MTKSFLLPLAAALMLLLVPGPLSADLVPEEDPNGFTVDAFEKTPEKSSVSTRYRIFDSVGNALNLQELVVGIKNSDVTFLGEIHTDTVAHYLESLLLEMTADERQSLSLEMFETDIQFVIDEYMEGLISEEHFLKSARSWENYESDYRKLIEFSKRRGIPVIAANAPRRYVNMVRRLGKDSLFSLSNDSKQFLPPLPYPEASTEYEKKFRAIMLAHQSILHTAYTSEEAEKLEDDDGDLNQAQIGLDKTNDLHQDAFMRMLAAQNLWDSSMAWSIASHLKENPENRVIHINGSFHTDYSLGIPEHLQNFLPGLNLITVTMVPSKDYPNFNKSMRGLGDYIIVTDGKLNPSH